MTKRVSTPAAPLLAAALLSLLVAGLALSGCDIAEPKLPTFETRFALPIGEERLDVLDAVDDEEYLVSLQDGLLGFQVEGDPDTVALDFDLAADIDARVLTSDLGDFSLDLASVDPFDFVLGDLYPAAWALNGMSVPVPAFIFGVQSPPENLAGVNSVTISSGTVTVRLDNGLPVPVSGTTAPEAIQLRLQDASGGGTILTLDFDQEIPAGGQAELTADLAGVVLPGSIMVALDGGSPGSGGTPVTVDAAATIRAEVTFSPLEIFAADAEIPAQDISRDELVDLPAGYGLIDAAIESGVITVNMTNDMPVPCQAAVTWPEVLDAGGQPVALTLDLAPFTTAGATMDFAGARIVAPGLAPINQLTTNISLTSPGSGGGIVTIPAGASVSASMDAARLVFGSATGVFPEEIFAIDPIVEDIDLPDELNGVELNRAALVLTVDNTAGVSATADLVLTGTSESGNLVTMAVNEPIGAAGVTEIVLDETNSAIVDFLNNLPVTVTLAGDVRAGGPFAVGTVSPGDRIVVDWNILAPVEIIINDSHLWGDPEDLDLDQDTRDLIADHALDANVLMEIDNHLPMGVEATLLFSPDTTTIRTDPLLTVGPVTVSAGRVDPLTMRVMSAVTSTPEVNLTVAESKLLGTEGLYSVVRVQLLDTNGQPVQVLATDYVVFRGMVRMNFEVSEDD
ncbi:MAG: hypothetical protein GY838_10130 [bacterium]|nr:hypothetical protein [bacterium]